jgi:hypothetical protein
MARPPPVLMLCMATVPCCALRVMSHCPLSVPWSPYSAGHISIEPPLRLSPLPAHRQPVCLPADWLPNNLNGEVKVSHL